MKTGFLTHTGNFSIGSAFSKGPCPSPLYKVCHQKDGNFGKM